jgi:hypothetical protein
MNEEPTILRELLNVLHEEELIRLAYRLRRAGKALTPTIYSAIGQLNRELAIREAQSEVIFGGTADPPVTPQDAPGPS